MIGVLSFILILVMIKELVEVRDLILGYTQNERRLQSQFEAGLYLLADEWNGVKSYPVEVSEDGADLRNLKRPRISIRYGLTLCRG